MKISIFSDLHLGYGYNTETENDCFDNAEEAMDKALDSDLIIIPGDIFDTRMPRTDTWARAVHILAKPLFKETTVKLAEATKELKEISKRNLKHLPVIVLHGNHDRKLKGEVNPVEVLEHAGILIYLHLNTIVFEKNGVKVAIHGMSYVPDRYAKDIMDKWNPKPIEGCINILILHQNIEPYVFSPLDLPSLSTSNLPKGFDYIVNGHIHTRTVEKIDGTTLIIAGNTLVTQLEKNESQIEKGITQIDTDSEEKVKFIPLQNNRKFIYEEISLIDGQPSREIIERKLHELVYTRNFSKSPIVKFKIIGKETEVLDQELRYLEKKYSDKAIIKFSKELESPEMTKKIEFLRNLVEQKKSVEEIGLSILKKNLDELKFESDFDFDDIFSILSEGEVDKAFNILLGEQKTLSSVLKLR